MEWEKRQKVRFVGQKTVDIEARISMTVTLYGSMGLDLSSPYKANIG